MRARSQSKMGLAVKGRQGFPLLFRIALFTCGEASRSMDDICPFFLSGTFSSEKHLGARKALEHGLLRPLSSNLRCKVTSEVVWRPPWPQRPPKLPF